MQWYSDLSEQERFWVRKKALVFFLLFSVLLLAVIVSFGVGIWKDVNAGRAKPLQIAVDGQGTVSAKPDIVKFDATVLTERAALADAETDNTTRANAVAAYLTANGVLEKDIKTTNYMILPQYSYPPPCLTYPCPQSVPPKITGYQITNTLAVTIRNIAKAGDLLSGVVGAGANEVANFQFTIDDPAALKADAEKKAIDDARGKAGELAKNLGKRLGNIVSFSESGTAPPPVIFAAGIGKGDGAAAAPEVQPGENEITANVTVTFEFK